jgi:hypothetical protein
MSRFALACLCVFAFGLAPAAAQTAPSSTPTPAAPSSPSPEAVKIAAALAKITSFRLQINSTNGVAGTVTVMVPAKRSKLLVAVGPMVSEAVMADGRMYMRMNGGDWRLNDTPGGGSFADAALKQLSDPAKFRMLPDRVENGTTVGVYEIPRPVPPGAAPGAAPAPVTCTYDKTTYLPRACTVQTITQTFEGWNDPANVVNVPVVASPKP